jgi:hypothetical protein
MKTTTQKQTVLTKEQFEAVQWALMELLNLDGCDDDPRIDVLQTIVTANRQ